MISPMSDEMSKGQCCTDLVHMVTAMIENVVLILNIKLNCIQL